MRGGALFKGKEGRGDFRKNSTKGGYIPNPYGRDLGLGYRVRTPSSQEGDRGVEKFMITTRIEPPLLTRSFDTVVTVDTKASLNEKILIYLTH